MTDWPPKPEIDDPAVSSQKLAPMSENTPDFAEQKGANEWVSHEPPG
jgi:hypothetical protein